MQNTLTAAQHVVNVAKKQLPYGNNFTQLRAALKQHGGHPEIHAVVQCAANSHEPGRTYFVAYTLAGVMQECYTLD